MAGHGSGRCRNETVVSWHGGRGSTPNEVLQSTTEHPSSQNVYSISPPHPPPNYLQVSGSSLCGCPFCANLGTGRYCEPCLSGFIILEGALARRASFFDHSPPVPVFAPTSPNNLEYLLAVCKNLAHPLHSVSDDGKGGG